MDEGPWGAGPLREETSAAAPPTAALEALARTLRHRGAIVRANPADAAVANEALRCALSFLVDPAAPPPRAPAGGDCALRYIRDRVNVPRDMGIHAGQLLRHALETAAATAGAGQGPPIPSRHRRDQDPRDFASSGT